MRRKKRIAKTQWSLLDWTVYYTLQELHHSSTEFRKIGISQGQRNIQGQRTWSLFYPSLKKRDFRDSQIYFETSGWFSFYGTDVVYTYCEPILTIYCWHKMNWPQIRRDMDTTQYALIRPGETRWIDQYVIAVDITSYVAPSIWFGPALWANIAKTIRYRCVIMWKYCIFNTWGRRLQRIY